MDFQKSTKDEFQTKLILASKINRSIQALISNKLDTKVPVEDREMTLLSLYQRKAVVDVELSRIRAINKKLHELNVLMSIRKMDNTFFKTMKTSHSHLSKLDKEISIKDVDKLQQKYKKVLDRKTTYEVIEALENIFTPVNEELEKETEIRSESCVNEFNEKTKELIEQLSQPSYLDQINETFSQS